MKDLAPDIYRQRLVVEGIPRQNITADEIVDYLTQLSAVIDMVPLMTPITHSSPKFGWAGWIHWETSGAHFYAWDEPRLFFSVDIYSCKAFENSDAVDFTGKFFEADDLVSKAF